MTAGRDVVGVLVTPDDIERAATRIERFVRRTPVIEHGGVWLKLELLQHTGSFKPRGRVQSDADGAGSGCRRDRRQRRQPRGGCGLRGVTARLLRRGDDPVDITVAETGADRAIWAQAVVVDGSTTTPSGWPSSVRYRPER